MDDLNQNGVNPDIWAIPTPLAEKIMQVLINRPWWEVGALMKELEPYAVWRQEPPRPVEITEGVAE